MFCPPWKFLPSPGKKSADAHGSGKRNRKLKKKLNYQEVSGRSPAANETRDAGDAGEHEEEGEGDNATATQVKPDGSVISLSQNKYST